MLLRYKFEYTSNNNTLIRFLTKIANISDIDYKITKNDNEINLYAQGEEQEQIKLSANISKDLPISIFLENSSVELVEQMPQESYETDTSKEFNFAFCPNCLQEVEDEQSLNYHNPFIACEMCNDYLNNEEQKVDYKKVFQEIATKIDQGQKVKIKSISGTFIYEKIDNLKNNQNQENISLLCTDLTKLATVVVASSNEISALASIEKPEIDFKVNQVYKFKDIVAVPTLSVRYASDMILYLLSKELIELNIDFLSYNKDGDYDLCFEFDNVKTESVNIPKVKFLQEEKLIILKSKNYSRNLLKIYNNFSDKSKGQFMVLMHENNLLEKSILNFYASSCDNDDISLYSDEVDGFLDILKFELPNSIEELFDGIKKDDTGVRLLNSYREKFPQEYENALNFDMDTLHKKSIFSLWEIVKVILNFDDAILESASECLLEKGPRIDYKLEANDKFYNKKFNIIKLIKSGMSFKLAGADNNTIALGYVESYIHMISNIVDEVNNEIELDGISFSGDVFASDITSKIVQNSVSKFYNLYYNKDFVIQVY